MPKTRTGKIIVFGTLGLSLLIVIALAATPSSNEGSSSSQAATAPAPARTTTSPATTSTTASGASNSGSSSSSQAAVDQAPARATTTSATASNASSGGSSRSSDATESASADREEPDSSGEDIAQDARSEPTVAEAPAPPPVGVSGRGQDVQSIDLAAGIWFCDVSVSDNDDEYGPGYFSVEFTGRDGGYDLLANEIETDWSARKRVSVGSGFLDDFSARGD